MAENTTPPTAAIGASAGGVEALKDLLVAVPERSGIAYLVLLHTGENPHSKIVEVLGSHVKIPVTLGTTGARIEPDTVYVAPPGQDMVLRGGSLIVQPRPPVQPERPVDDLFESVAADAQERAIGIVLSGTGTNGTAGLRSIKAAGGIAVAQDLSTAGFADMPRSAIASGLVDLILPPREIPAALIRYVAHPYVATAARQEAEDATPSQQLSSILALLKTRTNHDFHGYKRRTLTRRVFRRMSLKHLEGMDDYLQCLRTDAKEVQALIGDLLISVIGFFRDPEAWDELDERVIRPLVQEGKDQGSIRVWVPACATGEEAYTVAMLLLDRVHEARKSFDIKVFATDADANALQRGRAGIYPASGMAGVSPERLQHYFEKHDHTYSIKKELRELVIFAPQDILSDPPFSHLDLVTCRNLLIYLEPPLQKRVLALIHFGLRSGGYLFLGNAETIGADEQLFRTLSKKWRIFRKTGEGQRAVVEFAAVGSGRQRGADVIGDGSARLHQRAADQAYRAMVQEFAPPSVLIDEHYRILYYHGETESYLRQPPGEPTNDLLILVREGLRSPVRNAVQSALRERRRIRFTARVRQQTGYQPIEVTVMPAQHAGDQDPRVLVSFVDAQDAAPANQNAGQLPADPMIGEGTLEEELRSVREELRSTIEQLESSNEELKASNEEVTSTNEELQSTNEELETSKEELQSLNEELNTVNSELQIKVEELEDRTNNLNNLLNSSAIATLFLDTRFSIRWFTPAMRSLLEVLPTDIGRPIGHLAPKFEDPSFLEDARRALEGVMPGEKEVRNEEGRWYMRRILPYRTEDNRIDGVVVTFTDITERRHWEENLRQSRDFAERIIDTLQESLVVLEPDLRVRSANRSFYETFKLPRGEVEGQLLFGIGRGEWDLPELRRVLSTDLQSAHVMQNIVVEPQFQDFGKRVLSVNIRLLADERLVLLVIDDITQRREYERRQEVLLAELQHRVKNILASVQAIGRMTYQRSTSLDEFWEAFQGRVMALAATQELLTRTTLERVSLKDLIDLELAAQGARSQDYKVDGPALALTPKAAQNLALALHELMTNATKHGALSQPGGQVEISWQVADSHVKLHWNEHNGPSVKPPQRQGFGTELLCKAIPYQLRGKTRLDFPPEGLRCELDFALAGNIGPLETIEDEREAGMLPAFDPRR